MLLYTPNITNNKLFKHIGIICQTKKIVTASNGTCTTHIYKGHVNLFRVDDIWRIPNDKRMLGCDVMSQNTDNYDGILRNR